MAKRIQVGGRIESKEVGGIVTGAAEILDDAKGKKQSVINVETDDELVRLDQSKQNNLTFDNAPTEGSDNPVKSGGVYAADKALSDAIEAILLLIPSAASALNKLVDTAMMNSSISTATATFKGTYNVVTDLSLTVDATHEQIAEALGNVISTADNNDYAFVQIPVSAESTDIRRTERYKFNGTVWGYEYDLNTSGFTAAQWAAINSGITLALVGKLIGLPTSSELQALLGQKQDTLTFDNVPTAGSANPVKSGGVYSAINDEKTAREQLAQTVTGIDGRVENVEGVIPTGAAANNKLVANNSMEAYVTSIIEAITASFTIATADGHINLTLTQTNGRVASLTLTSSDIASAQALTALTGRVTTAEGNITTINGNITSLGGRVSTNETDIANLQQLYTDLQQSKPEPVTALPETGQQQGVIYRLAGTTSYSDYMWNGSTWVLMATYNNAIDPRPKKSSQNLVTSGGVFDNMGALDVSELNATENPHTLAQYVDLSAALAAIPTDYQKGGMSIKFVRTSDNKYVQYRLMAQIFTTNVTEWEGIEDFVKGIGTFRGPAPDRNPLITDADDAEVNRIYAIGKANYVAHLPSDGQGVLQTLSYASNVADIRLQIFVSAVTEELYWRIKFGSSYGEWNGGKTKFFEDAIDSLQHNTIPCTNGTLLDQENWINNHYLNGNNTQGESSEFAISNYIPCTKGQTIYFTNCGNNLVLFYDENNNYISGYNTNTNAGYVTVPNSNSIAYLRFNVMKANIGNGLFVSYNENDHIWNIPYGEKKYTINDIAGLDIKVTEDVTIGIEYNTLKSALDYADAVANENHIVNILVPTGEYNVFSDIDLYSQDSSFKGLIVPNYVNIIGIGAAKDVILKAELPVDMTGYAFIRGNVSTLNLWRNNSLKNLTVIGSNMRYAIHNDTAIGTAGYVENAQEVFENCIFIGKQTDVAVNVDSSFGSGMKNGAYLKFKNCKFIIESVATESTGVTFATNFHNTANSFKTITWRFENCLFSSGYKNFAMYVTNYSGVKNGVIILNGCKIDKRICAASQTGSRNSDYVYYGSGSVFTDTRKFYTNGVDLVDEDTEMLL